jgi:spore coat polysaccharide biosynthesis protein SpsF (cytidylyltransferase family)
MRSNELKFLANLAKQRLMNKDYSVSQTANRNKASNYFIQNAMAIKKLKAETNYVTIKDQEDIEFVERVRTLINEDCYNPLGKLCDKEYFSTLDAIQKEFYILNLSEKYNKVKNELLIG